MKRSLIGLMTIVFLAPCFAKVAWATKPSKSATIKILSPQGGESLLAGTSQTIQWEYKNVGPGETVTIKLFDGTTPVQTISSAASTGSDGTGSYIWPILSNQSTGNNYKIKIISNVYDVSSTSGTFSISCQCNSPPFASSDIKPNVLIILDNSNSMDENFWGGAVGSYSFAGKSLVARLALKEFVTQLKDKLRIGLMTYKLKDDVEKRYLHNAAYFASYNPKSYCPNPPAECVEYCQTGDSAKQAACVDGCKKGNELFDPDYFDEIITNYSTDSERRNRYCSLVYPKAQRIPNPTDRLNYIYVKQAYPYYDVKNQGTGFFYSENYNPDEGGDTYIPYLTKVGIDDGSTGYSDGLAPVSLGPTDSDYALGYHDFGRRIPWYYVGETWYSNSSPGGGFLHVPVGELNEIVDGITTTTTNYSSLLEKLGPTADVETANEADVQAAYMFCTASDKNTCSYIINAGLTPTAGTLQTALDYFKDETNSPIQARCQKNYIIYVTDGLPSVDESGRTGNAVTLMPTVLEKLDSLRTTITKPFAVDNNRVTYSFDVRTYVLGVGLSDSAKSQLDTMAVHGGTAVNGHAYYADDPGKLIDALSTIFSNILSQTSSGTSVSILSEKAQQGANMMQAVFYPSKKYGDSNNWLNWTGYLYDYWFYVSKTESNLREDTEQNNILDLDADYGLTFDFDTAKSQLLIQRWQDLNGDGNLTEDATVGDPITLDEVAAIWEAGELLSRRSGLDSDSDPPPPDPRKIYTVSSSNQLVEFKAANLDDFKTYLGAPGSFAGCLKGADDNATLANLVDYVRGTDIAECRNRSFSIQEGSTTNTYTWKLGDIVYSTPKVESDYKYCYDSTAQQFTSTLCTTDTQCGTSGTCKKKESVVFVGANDGMLHAFKTGILSKNKSGLSDKQAAKLEGTEFGKELWAFIPKNILPYLRCLANSDYCHLSYVDLSPHIVTMGNKRVLIGGMRLGGGTCDASQLTGIPCDAPSDTCSAISCTSWDSCFNPSNCVGLSSYFALDITDAESPQLLWEFSHPQLGYSYSGPAVIHRKVKSASGNLAEKYFVMFLSGPTSRNGTSNQTLKAFILSLDDQLKLPSNGLYVHTFGTNTKYAFGGRLFTNGLDINEDGYTDFVLFGYSDGDQKETIGAFSGGIIKLWTGDHDTTDTTPEPRSWEFKEPFYNAGQPITAKVEAMKCFNQWYVYFGTGRYFIKDDNPDHNQSNSIYGIPFLCTANDTDCSTINFGHASSTFCESLSKKAQQMAWNWPLEIPVDTGYYKERCITDPTVSSQDIVYFTTTEPTSDPCSFGGRSRIWGLNCATGEAIADETCPLYVVRNTDGAIYLQTSTGAITKISADPSNSSFTCGKTKDTDATGKTSEWIPGIPPESAPPLVPPFSLKTGKILHWIEK
ncbi:Ser-Thr-rich GPI-anchored membrane family protein [Desulforhabdus amnigena]|uniref:VWFA domain-containing protein n=1 Tax=Desulforhabdus amnigena TaxID=40218 RepID=A0A9W6FVM8_9BACT|nr:Ser-Thr-rich GPI-anchored membrane family protein [Desulforhabdus amnigena]GLI35736.1 hypothetical protein DAMNIGENAA_31690 [Desulforhabdus amnigena]